MSPCELTMTVTALANVIAQNLSEYELQVLSSALNQLGDTLSTILAQRECNEQSGILPLRSNGKNGEGEKES